MRHLREAGAQSVRYHRIPPLDAGETEKEVGELLDFVEEVRFYHLGAFVFSPEEGTPAAVDAVARIGAGEAVSSAASISGGLITMSVTVPGAMPAASRAIHPSRSLDALT